MNEDFLHFIWKYRLYNRYLVTTTGMPVEVINPGQPNTDAGPDFSNARIRIENTVWAGNIEVHVKASDWFSHHHNQDQAYQNIILHVVYANDEHVTDHSGKPVKTLELASQMNKGVYEKYTYFLQNKNWIPCEKELGLVSPITLKAWMERLFVERMERKCEELMRLLKNNRNSFEETFYQVLAGNFGFKINKQPFVILSRLVPLKTAAKHRNRLMQLEALYFGTSGLLDDIPEEDYPQALKQEYNFLRNKYSQGKMEKHLWKFLRLRPSNFPTIRISQFAALLNQSDQLISKILECKDIRDLQNLFNVKASPYWDTHYTFGKPSQKRIKKLGINAVNVIIINTVAQFLILYSKIKNEPGYQEKAIEMLGNLPPEKNHILNGWSKNNIRPENAFESQALIELKNSYCNLKKCLHCGIGMSLLKMNA